MYDVMASTIHPSICLSIHLPVYLPMHLPIHLWRDLALLFTVYHVARPHCAELDVRARARRAVEIVDDAEVVRVGRQQQPQQPQHQSLAAAARRVGAVRTVDTYRSSRAAPLRWRGVCRAHEGAQAGSSARGGAYRRGLLAYWAAELSASRMQPMIGLSGRRCRRCRQ